MIGPRLTTRAAIGCLLTSRPGFAVVGETSTIQEAVGMTGALRPDVVLLTPGAHAPGGSDSVAVLAGASGAPLPVVFLLDAGEPHPHAHGSTRGASACVSTSEPADTLLGAIERVCREVPLANGPRLEARAAAPLDGTRSRIGALTRREREVVSLVCEGLRNKQIAHRLTVTDVTVRHHLTSVFSKLGVTDRLGLLIFATRHGLTPHAGRLDGHG